MEAPDRKLSKKELKFLQRLGITADEHTSLSKMQELLKNCVVQQGDTVSSDEKGTENEATDTALISSELGGGETVPSEVASATTIGATDSAKATMEISDENANVIENFPKRDENDDFSDDLQKQLDKMVLHVPTATELKLRQLEEEEMLLDAQLRMQKKKLELLELNSEMCDISLAGDTRKEASPAKSESIDPSGTPKERSETGKTWGSIVEEEENASSLQTSKSSGDDNHSEIQQRIEAEQEKLKGYALQIDRLNKEIAIIEHQREISVLNLSLLEVSLPTNSKNKKPTEVPTSSDAKILCYNCSSYGHYSTECKAPKREKGSCFHCGSIWHVVKNCPEKEKTSKQKEQKPTQQNQDEEW